MVAAVTGLDPAEILAPVRRSARVALARQIAMYISHVGCGLSAGEVAALAPGRAMLTVQTGVKRAQAMVEVREGAHNG